MRTCPTIYGREDVKLHNHNIHVDYSSVIRFKQKRTNKISTNDMNVLIYNGLQSFSIIIISLV